MFHWTVVSASDDSEVAQCRPPAAFLSAAEEAVYAKFRFAERRRKWLIGRRAAKELVARTLASETGRAPPPPRDITVANEPSGAPFAEVRGYGRITRDLSLSHRSTFGLAALAAEPGVALGADLELIVPRDPGLVRDFFSADEAGRVANHTGRAAELEVARIWSAKESVLKAMKLGLRLDTRSVVIGDEHEVPQWVPPLPDWRACTAHVQKPALRFRVYWRDQGPYVITVALQHDA